MLWLTSNQRILVKRQELATLLYQGNPDRNQKLWNIVSEQFQNALIIDKLVSGDAVTVSCFALLSFFDFVFCFVFVLFLTCFCFCLFVCLFFCFCCLPKEPFCYFAHIDSMSELVEQELLTIPRHMSSPRGISGYHVTRSLVLCVCFVDRCLSFFFWPLC